MGFRIQHPSDPGGRGCALSCIRAFVVANPCLLGDGIFQRARALGLSIEDCRALRALYADKSRASAEVKKIAQGHLDDIAAKIADQNAMRSTLKHLVDTCAGDGRPDCPILDDLGAVTSAPSS